MTTEMLNLEISDFVELSFIDLDKIATEFYGIPYRCLDSDNGEIYANDTLLKYVLSHDYDRLIKDFPNWEQTVEKWREESKRKAERKAEMDEYSYQREVIATPSWELMLTMLIRDGRLPRNNYLFEISW